MNERRLTAGFGDDLEKAIRALEEAGQLGSISPVMKTFALDYIQAHKK
jgi:hypothetical protein